jgi:uncharacterized protein
METITDLKSLRAIVGDPSELTEKKIYSHLNEQASEFIAQSPFLVLSTVDTNNMPTASPKGDEPGFVYQADAQTLYMPERKGNRLVISYQNVFANAKVGLIFLKPRCSETLRVSGTAELVTDQALCEQLTSRGNPALLLLKITVTQAYFHCGKAFIRSNLWNPESWPTEETRVSFGKEIGDNIGKDQAFVKDLDAQVVERYKDAL